MAASLLARLVWVIDVKGYQVWCQPFRTLGLNPLFVYLLSEYAAVTLDNISIAYHDRMISLHSYIYRVWLHPLLGGYGGSLAYALLFVATCWLVGYLLQRRNIYIKL
jgi:predicted acyltransferase